MTSETHSLSRIVAAVTADAYTLSLFNYEGPTERKDSVTSYFGPQSVQIREVRTPSESPTNYAVLHDGDEFVAAASVETLHDHITGEHLFDSDGTGQVERPPILDHVDNRTFTSYGRQRMILASREMELRAWRHGTGELHAGFQRLSLLRSQRAVYDKLRESDIDVHVYGEPDAEVPPGVYEHASEDEEIVGSWFVVYDGGGCDTNSCAMVAVEQDDGTFSGCWTFETALVERTLDRLRAEYPETAATAEASSTP
jgi:hypothetical protein